MRKNSKKSRGFTLVELIIVLAVLMVLSVLAVLAYTNLQSQFVEGARVADANTVARQINTANSALPPEGQIKTAPTLNGETFIIRAEKEGTGEGKGALLELDLSVRVDPNRWEGVSLTDYIEPRIDEGFVYWTPIEQ